MQKWLFISMLILTFGLYQNCSMSTSTSQNPYQSSSSLSESSSSGSRYSRDSSSGYASFQSEGEGYESSDYYEPKRRVSSEEEQRTICEKARDKGLIKTKTVRIRFSKKSRGCNQSDSLPNAPGFLQAKSVVQQDIDIPAKAYLCDTQMQFNLVSNRFNYSDQFIFTLNDVVLVSSSSFSGLLEKEGDLLIYDWQKLAGAQKPSGIRYCLGENQSLAYCSVPGRNKFGLMTYSPSQKIVQKISDYKLKNNKSQKNSFKFIVAGDHSRDCVRSAQDFYSRVSYVENPEEFVQVVERTSEDTMVSSSR